MSLLLGGSSKELSDGGQVQRRASGTTGQKEDFGDETVFILSVLISLIFVFLVFVCLFDVISQPVST